MHYTMRIMTEKFFWSNNCESYMVENGTIPIQFRSPAIGDQPSQTDRFTIFYVNTEDTYNNNVNQGITVAIGRKEQGDNQYSYLSYKRKAIFINAYQCSYKCEVTETEIFYMRFCERSNTYWFKTLTHDYYMHYNETHFAIEFKSCRQRSEEGLPVKGQWELRDSNREDGRVEKPFDEARATVGDVVEDVIEEVVDNVIEEVVEEVVDNFCRFFW